MATYEDICLWKKDRLQAFLRARGIATSGRKEELRALSYGAKYFNIPLKPTAEEEKKEIAERYRSLLTFNDTTLPDPLSDLPNGWVGEEKGRFMWPPCMYGDLAEYLVSKGERDLRTRLLTDYKDGKSFSYFDSKWLREVFYHNVSEESPLCFMKAQCTPSMNISHEPHDVWVCINKKTGKIMSAYCSCFAG